MRESYKSSFIIFYGYNMKKIYWIIIFLIFILTIFFTVHRTKNIVEEKMKQTLRTSEEVESILDDYWKQCWEIIEQATSSVFQNAIEIIEKDHWISLEWFELSTSVVIE